jgi:hypothetical protein
MQLPVGAVRVSDDFASGTRAAAIGGTTTIIDYVTVERGADPMAAVAKWRLRAEPSTIDWGLYLTFTETVPESVIAAGAQAGITSFKLYLAYPDRLQADDGTIVNLMRSARRQGALVTLHCENGDAIEELRREALSARPRAVVEHALTRPAILEGEATSRAAVLAELTGISIYVVKDAKMWTAATKFGLRGTDGTDERLGSRQCLGRRTHCGPAPRQRICRAGGDTCQVPHLKHATGPPPSRGALGYAATGRYSWTSPPSTSCRLTADDASPSGAARPAGTPRSRPRCGRPVL